MPKGEKLIGPKQKNRTTTIFFKNCFKKGRNYSNYKTLLTTKGRTSLGGAFYLAKGKTFETGGKFQNLEKCVLKSYSYHWLFAKEFEKYIYKRFAKTS
jgi:hypothetical protein